MALHIIHPAAFSNNYLDKHVLFGHGFLFARRCEVALSTTQHYLLEAQAKTASTSTSYTVFSASSVCVRYAHQGSCSYHNNEPTGRLLKPRLQKSIDVVRWCSRILVHIPTLDFWHPHWAATVCSKKVPLGSHTFEPGLKIDCLSVLSRTPHSGLPIEFMTRLTDPSIQSLHHGGKIQNP